MIMELYDTRYDPNLTEALATTNIISQASLTYRFDFQSIHTYTDFIGEDSLTSIVKYTYAITANAII